MSSCLFSFSTYRAGAAEDVRGLIAILTEIETSRSGPVPAVEETGDVSGTADRKCPGYRVA
jgi:hypothetical protein